MSSVSHLAILLNQLKTTLDQSSLVSQLNLTPSSRVLDVTLSLTCFRSPQIYGTHIDTLLETIVSIFNSMAHCRFGNHSGLELVRVGRSISARDCWELVRIGAELVEILHAHYGSSSGTAHEFYTLSYSTLRAAVSSYNCSLFVSSTPVLLEEDEAINAGRQAAFMKLIQCPSSQLHNKSDKISLKLFSWYLDPLMLKHDIAEMLRETIQRPFLCLKEELYAQKSWHYLILCFVTSPTMFMETRAVMHSWFLLTGLASILNLQVAVVSSVLDFLSRPMFWGMSMEIGLKLPFTSAYFPKKHRDLLFILNGPISCESFLDLVHHIQTAVIPSLKYSNQNNMHAVDNNSAWSLLIGFPAWFYFAVIVIFHEEGPQDSCLSKAVIGTYKTVPGKLNSLHDAAAFYLSWVVNPISATSFSLLADHIYKAAKLWREKSASNSNKKKRQARITKLSASKVDNYDITFTLQTWIEEFNYFYITLTSGRHKTKHCDELQPNMFLKIPLGIMITTNNLDEKGVRLLLHYATTGRILQTREMNENIWTIGRASFIFDLIDILDDMSLKIFDSEETQANFIFKMKGKVSDYLMMCIDTFLKNPAETFHSEEERKTSMEDLHRRLTWWTQKHDGGTAEYNSFNETFDDFTKKFEAAMKIATEPSGKVVADTGQNYL